MFNFPEIKPFKYWCHKILPLVYDDSLSYMELLAKMSAKLNEIIAEHENITSAIEELDRRTEVIEILDERLIIIEEKIETLYNNLNGGTTGQYLTKNSDDNLDFKWESMPEHYDIPTGGETGQVLGKRSDSDYDVEWVNKGDEHGIPVGGTTGQVIRKSSNTDYDVEWSNVEAENGMPDGGTTGQVLTKMSDDDYDAHWVDLGGGGEIEIVQETGQSTTAVMSQKAVTDALDGTHELPSGGSVNQILKKNSATDYDTVWSENIANNGIPAGGNNGQILKKNGTTNYSTVWGDNIANNGIPTGGTAGQILKKNTGTNYDVSWASNVATNGLPAGGSVGQILTKYNSTDYNAEWVTNRAPATAKGSYVGNGSTERADAISITCHTPINILYIAKWVGGAGTAGIQRSAIKAFGIPNDNNYHTILLYDTYSEAVTLEVRVSTDKKTVSFYSPVGRVYLTDVNESGITYYWYALCD